MDGMLPPLPPLTRAQSDALRRRRRPRNWAILVSLLSLSLLFFGMTIVKMGHHCATADAALSGQGFCR
jgi:hypothetical protein